MFKLTDIRIKAISYIISRLNCDYLSYRQLISEFPWSKKLFKDTINFLFDMKIIEIKNGKYNICNENKFLYLKKYKYVRVPLNGNRHVSVSEMCIALSNDINEYEMGSIMLTQNNYYNARERFNYILRHTLNEKYEYEKKVYTSSREKFLDNNKIRFFVKFNPALESGEYIKIGFYLWIKNYYARTLNEEIKRFNSKFIREGLDLSHPVYSAGMEVKFQDGYIYNDPRIEMYPPGITRIDEDKCIVLKKFNSINNRLNFDILKPLPGSYFISWSPPDK